MHPGFPQAVSDYELRQEAAMGKEAVALRQHNHIVALLPQLFDGVRALFGLTGPSTRSLQQVHIVPSDCFIISQQPAGGCLVNGQTTARPCQQHLQQLADLNAA